MNENERGRYVCRECGSDNLTFPMDARWDVGKQGFRVVEGTDQKPYCQSCEGVASWAEFVPLERAEPSLCRDHYGDLFIVVDDDGEPVTPYRLSRKRAREDREDHGDGAERYRIVKVAYKALPRDDGEPDEIVDDPRAE